MQIIYDIRIALDHSVVEDRRSEAVLFGTRVAVSGAPRLAKKDLVAERCPDGSVLVRRRPTAADRDAEVSHD